MNIIRFTCYSGLKFAQTAESMSFFVLDTDMSLILEAEHFIVVSLAFQMPFTKIDQLHGILASSAPDRSFPEIGTPD